MDWVAILPPGGDKSYNECLAIADRYSKTPIFSHFRNMTQLWIQLFFFWNRVISHTGIFKNIISDRDPNLHQPYGLIYISVFGTKLSFSTAYHPQTDQLEKQMIQTLEDMIRRFCAYFLELKDSDGFTHDWCTIITALELAYKTSIHA
ncbi:hypothetical protein O181_042404 [Austropuccinia psidii MF-1]|uniref:Integrase catalytic domain-containing protein n=1 Tax=Austropuccinia psidii MF-1 TaxID=1389203 RepID=A0A9Q3HHF8_9BASI|nr:hypothetical protein [Austropuccinia psidii MF-1]